MSWVSNHRPPLVILENVCSAPWAAVVKYFEKVGYSAISCRVDTKNHYIPHTRTRGYLVAVNAKASGLPKKWQDLVRNLERQASSSFDAWLLPSDEPRIHQSRQKIARESDTTTDRRTGRTDWGRCESRHQRARLEEELGNKRPLTYWETGKSTISCLCCYLTTLILIFVLQVATVTLRSAGMTGQGLKSSEFGI
jgi:site-specific DNA-cytosine methylase